MGCQRLRFDIAQIRTKKPVRVASYGQGSRRLQVYRLDTSVGQAYLSSCSCYQRDTGKANLLPMIRISSTLSFFLRPEEAKNKRLHQQTCLALFESATEITTLIFLHPPQIRSDSLRNRDKRGKKRGNEANLLRCPSFSSYQLKV